MSTLYETLGVSKTADKDTIKKAYRKKAKRNHPDHGGTVEKFGQIKKAYDILADAERRAKYDATGDTSEKTPDNSHSVAVNIIASAFNIVLQECANQGQTPLEVNIISRVRAKIDDNIQESQKQIRIMKNMLDIDKKLSGKFTSKKENIFEGIVANRIMSLEINIKNCEENVKNSNTALEMINDATFKQDAKSEDDNRIGNFVFNVGYF